MKNAQVIAAEGASADDDIGERRVAGLLD
jgi:hypothetical protein